MSKTYLYERKRPRYYLYRMIVSIKSRSFRRCLVFPFFGIMVFDVARATPVDVANPVYPFLRRLEMEGRVQSGFLGTLPMAKSDVERMLNEAAVQEESLPGWERIRLDAYCREFGAAPEDSVRYKRIKYADSNFTVRISGDFFSEVDLSDSLPHARSLGFGFLSGTVEADYHQRLQFISNAGLGQERSLHERFTENYDPAKGLSYNTDREGKAGIPRTVSSMDGFRTVAGYEDPGLRIEFGTDWNQWGPGIWQHAFLSQKPWFWVQDSLPASDSTGFKGTPYPGRYRIGYRTPGETAPMPQFRMSFQMGKFSYTKVVAQRTGLWQDTMATLIAHRLEIKPLPTFTLGLQELAVSSGRPIDWMYVVPLVPIKFAEHALGDRDNIALGFDMNWTMPRHGRLYGELLIDDFSGWDLDFWGDKYAFSVGGEILGIPHLGASLFQLEYARVEPWVFTHYQSNTQLQHFGALLGSSLPPDSHALHGAWELPLRADLTVHAEYALMQRSVAARGASVFDFHQAAVDGTRKVFLDGTVETRQAAAFGAEWQWDRFATLKAELGYLTVENWKSVAGKSLDTPTASFAIDLRY